MNPLELWFPILTLAGFAVVVPAWMFFATQKLTAPIHIQFLATMVLPLLAMLFIASWVGGGA